MSIKIIWLLLVALFIPIESFADLDKIKRRIRRGSVDRAAAVFRETQIYVVGGQTLSRYNLLNANEEVKQAVLEGLDQKFGDKTSINEQPRVVVVPSDEPFNKALSELSLRVLNDEEGPVAEYIRWGDARVANNTILAARLNSEVESSDGVQMDWASHLALGSRLNLIQNEAILQRMSSANAAAEARATQKRRRSDLLERQNKSEEVEEASRRLNRR